MMLRKYKWFAGVLVITITSCVATSNNNDQESADLIITNAKIFTSNKEQPWAEAVAIKDGKFIYVGDSVGIAEYKSANTIDLNGKLVISGLTDAHSHPGYGGIEQFGEVEGETKEELLASVKAYADEHPDEEEWLRLCCWPTDMFVNGNEGPNKEVLDAVVPDRLVWFESSTAHDFWLNSKALEKIGVNRNTPDPRPGMAIYVRDENGELTGWIKEGAGVQYFANQFRLTEGQERAYEEQVITTLQNLSEFGITSLFDAGNKGYGDLVYKLISKLEREGKLPVRYEGTYQVFTPERLQKAIPEIKKYRKEYGGTLLKFNTVKIFMDGINENHSVGLLEPYANDTSYVGNTLLTSDELRDFLLELNIEKLNLHVHTIGDLTVRTVLDAVEAAQALAKDGFYPRVTIAHLELIDPADLPRIKELGVICNFTPWWLGVNNHDMVEVSLGEERYSNMYKAKSLFDLGTTVTFSSDEWWGGDMLRTYINPYFGMQIGHTRQYPKEWWETEDDGIRAPGDERLSLEQLIEGYTQNGSYQLRMERKLGSIEEGKLADLVVLDNNIFEVDRYEIMNVKPSVVMMEGKVIQGKLPE